MIKKYPTEFCLKYLVPHNIRRDNIKYTVQDRKYLHMLLNKMNNKKGWILRIIFNLHIYYSFSIILSLSSFVIIITNSLLEPKWDLFVKVSFIYGTYLVIKSSVTNKYFSQS